LQDSQRVGPRSRFLYSVYRFSISESSRARGGRISEKLAYVSFILDFWHRPDLVVPHIHLAHLGHVHGPCSSAPEDGQLIAAFIHGPIAVESFRYSKSWTMCMVAGDELRRWPRTESVVARGVGGCQLHDAKSV